MSFVQRELDRISTTLLERQENEDETYHRLYAAQQALAWALEPNGFKTPHDMVMGIQATTEDYPSLWSLPPS